MDTTRKFSESGMTLVEVLVSAAILGLVLSSVLAIASQSYRYLYDIRVSARSSQVLQQKMEDVRLLNWTQLNAIPTTFSDPFDTQKVFSGSITRSNYSSYGSTTTVSLVTLSVTWTNKAGRVRTNNLSTLMSSGGLNKYIF